ncbi:MAG TPA: hypothetical protein VND95_08625 [Stellaceae bacterium]|nr:hypothetical protein [Stellaceae bacterium]
MQIVPSWRPRQAAVAAALFLVLSAIPAAALDLFAQHEVTVQLATRDGKPMADVEVRVFAPGRPDRPAVVGRTDHSGRFEFSADADGFWSAEAKSGKEIVRVMVRVGDSGGPANQQPPSLFWAIGGLVALLILAFGFRFARARARRPPR